MLNQKDNDFDDLFRRASDKYPLRTDSADWNRMAAALDDPSSGLPELPDTDKRKKRRFIWFFLLLPLGGVGYYALHRTGIGHGHAVTTESVAKAPASGAGTNGEGTSSTDSSVSGEGAVASGAGAGAGKGSSGVATESVVKAPAGGSATVADGAGKVAGDAGKVAGGAGTVAGGAGKVAGSDGTVAGGAGAGAKGSVKTGGSGGVSATVPTAKGGSGAMRPGGRDVVTSGGGAGRKNGEGGIKDAASGGVVGGSRNGVVGGATGGMVSEGRGVGNDKSIEASRIEASRVEATRVEASRIEATRVESSRVANYPVNRAHISKDYNLTVNVVAPVVTKDSSKVKPKASSKQKSSFLYAGLLAAPDLSTVKFQSTKGVGTTFSLLLGYQFNKRWAVESGVSLDRKRYYTDGEYFDTKGVRNNPNPNWKLLNVDGTCYMWEVPVNVRYNFSQTDKSKWFATAGLSTYFMTREKYDYNSTYNGGPPTVSNWDLKKPSQYWFSIINLSAGYEHSLGAIGNLRIEPYLRVPLSGLGTGKLNILSTGINIGITRRLW